MKAAKGEKGYRMVRRRRLLLWVFVFGAAIIAQLLARSFTASIPARNILTVMAVLTVLPAANVASPLLAAWKYRQPDEGFYLEMAPFEKKAVILYELLITSKDFIMPADAIAVCPQGVLVYCPKETIDSGKAEGFLNEMLSSHRLAPKAKVFKDRKAFIRRLENLKPAAGMEAVQETVSLIPELSMPEPEGDRVAGLLKSLSM